MNNNLLPACPNFAAHPIIYKHKAGMWECLECEIRFNGTAPQAATADNSLLTSKTTNPKVVFFSYGHDDNQELVDRFKTDLEKRGHTVWIDYKEIGNWSDWKGKITQGIHDSDLVLAFLSKHATRDPGVCSNEIAMALNRFGTVYPVLLEPVNDVTPPVTISHLQWQDLSLWRDIRDGKVEGKDWARWYEEKLIQIITLLEGEASEFEGDIKSLREVLKPVSFTSDIARHIPEFVGREWVFDAYQNWLDNQPQSRLFWIKAGPGVGKTAIAAMLAHTRQSAIVGAWFCQSNSIERRDTRKALCSLAFQLASRWDDYRRKLRFQLGFNASTQPDDWKDLREALLKKNETDLFNFLFTEPLTGLIYRDHRLVVVIDALDEASDSNGQNPLVDLLVTRLANLPSWLSFVVTSRPNPEIVAKLQGFAPFELDTENHRNMDDLKAYLDIGLAKRVDFSALPDDEQSRIKIILLDNSEGMILYLQQVLTGLDEGVINLDNIEHIPRGLGSLYRITFDHYFGGDKLQSVYDHEVKPLLRLLLAAPEPLPPALAQQVLGWDKETYLRRRNRLGSYVIDTPQGCELFHKTLHEWLGDEASSPYYLDPQPGKQALAEYLWQCFDNTEDEYHLDWPHQTQHWLPSLMPLLPQWETAGALNALGNYLYTFAQYSDAEVLLRRALAINEKFLGLEHPVTASSLNNLAFLLQVQGDYVGAELLHRRALVIAEKVLGPEHPLTAASLNNLGICLQDQGNYAGAEPLYRRALAIREKVLGSEHPDTASGLGNLASLLHAQGDYAGAEPLHRRALAIDEKILGPEHPSTARGLHNLALLLQDQGDYSGAEPLYRRALAIREKFLGSEHPDTAANLNAIAGLLQTKGNYAGAESLYRRALAIREKFLAPHHPDIAINLHDLACLLFTKGDYSGAELLYRRTLTSMEKSFGIEHPLIAGSINSLAGLLQTKGDYAGAEPLYRRALAIREKMLDSDHPDIASSLHGLACLLENQADYAGAEALHRRALAIFEKALGGEHRNTAGSINSIARLLETKGDYAGAELLYRSSLAISEKTLGPDHPETASSLHSLACLLQRKDDNTGAEILYQRALAIKEKVLGSEHPAIASTLNNRAGILQAQGNHAAAEQLFRHALAIHEKSHGPEHPDTASSLINLARVLKEGGNFADAEPMYRRALIILEKTRGAEHPDTAACLNNLAQLLKELGDYVGAEPLFRRALMIREISLGAAHPRTVVVVNNLCRMLKEKGKKSYKRKDWNTASTELKEALSLAKRAQDMDSISACHNELKYMEKAIQQQKIKKGKR